MSEEAPSIYQLVKSQGHLEGRVGVLEAALAVVRADQLSTQATFSSKLDAMDTKLDKLASNQEQNVAFLRGAKWVFIAVGAVLIWVLDHVASIANFFMKP